MKKNGYENKVAVDDSLPYYIAPSSTKAEQPEPQKTEISPL